MKLFFIGDFAGDNGPASVNKVLKKYMNDNTFYSRETKKHKRLIELFLKITKTDGVLFSGLSKVNVIGFRLAKLLSKKSAYLMHGSELIEGKINQNYNQKLIDLENKVLKLAPKIICVSENFMHTFNENYPQYKHKVTYVNNGVDWDLIGLSDHLKVKRKKNMLLSVGGGVPRKNILKLCEAIDILNTKKKLNLELMVIGSHGPDTKQIKSYPFVTYIEKVPKKEMPRFYKMSQLYIQNSRFETFGLAVIEALMCGSSILISKNVGAKGIIPQLDNNNIINDVDDTE
ncbi:glycosyltransferase family 4 protein, partial [Peribacillus sp. NPDC060253]|uniref:glycosyltransferase family 4 protein n=1 Tax=Peribacillus sp. NPDC060253 TaxID=3347084 RepID=UPI00366620EC